MQFASHVWVMVVSFSSNFLSAGGGEGTSSGNRTSIMPGGPVVGIVEPTFGKYHTD